MYGLTIKWRNKPSKILRFSSFGFKKLILFIINVVKIPISTSNSTCVDSIEKLFLSNIISKFLHFVTVVNGDVSAEGPDGFYINISSNEAAC